MLTRKKSKRDEKGQRVSPEDIDDDDEYGMDVVWVCMVCKHTHA